MTALDPTARLARIRAAVDARPKRCDDDYELMLGEIDRLNRRVNELEAEQKEDTGVTRALRRQRDTAEARVTELEALKPAQVQTCQTCGAGYTHGDPCSNCEFKKQMAAERRQRPGACGSCGDIPDEWCPDCACCRNGCFGGHEGNPCTHPNAPWNKENHRAES